MQIGLIVLLFLAVYTTLAISLPPTRRFAADNEAYTHVFGKSQRIIFASLVAFWVSERFDIHIFTKIREKLGKRRLWLRNNISNLLSQFLDTTLFMLLAFYSSGNSSFIFSLIIPYWLLKSSFSAMHTPLTYWGVVWLKKNNVMCK